MEIFQDNIQEKDKEMQYGKVKSEYNQGWFSTSFPLYTVFFLLVFSLCLNDLKY